MIKAVYYICLFNYSFIHFLFIYIFVLDKEFVINKVLELQLEFRTSITSGVLLSIADQSGKPALSLEINDSKVLHIP